MTYIERLAADIRGLVAPESMPEGDTDLLFEIYAVLVLAKGSDVSPADVHNAWCVWISEFDPHHDALRPYEELDADTQAGDLPFLRAIREIAQLG